jgi:hypothetical protein
MSLPHYGGSPVKKNPREASYYRFIGIQTDGRPSLVEPPLALCPSLSKYVLESTQTVQFVSTHPRQPLDHYDATDTLGLFSERTAPGVRELLGEGLVERPAFVDGRLYHFFLEVPAVDALDLEKSDFRRYPGRERIEAVWHYVFIDSVVGEAPRMFRLGGFVNHRIVNAAGARVIRALKVTGCKLSPL